MDNDIKFQKEFCGERKSFIQLIADYDIVIPVIQRDYAQGRSDEHATEVRKGFVEKLINYIFDPQKISHDLYFIYGTVDAEEGDRSKFVPLDGQQRLTTLFLLYFFIGGQNHFGEINSTMRNCFSYKNRDSSKMFCAQLFSEYEKKENDKIIKTNIFAEHKKEKSNDSKRKLSDTIRNQGWFYESWMQDPTISGMLTMLDEIEKQMYQKEFEYAYERLFEINKNENPPITFQMLPLNKYSRTDDLYIKLNARGLHLSDFENFKARLEDFISYSRIQLIDFKGKSVNLNKAIDVDWNDYLWNYRNGSDSTDKIMESLFRLFVAFSYRSNKLKSNKIKERMEYLMEQNGKKLRFTFSRFCELEVFHKRDDSIDSDRMKEESEMMNKISDFFNIFCNQESSPEFYQNKWLKTSDFISNGIVNEKASFSQRIRLYAYLQYYRKHSECLDKQDLDEWMRLVRNLDDATDIDDAGAFYNALRSIDNLIERIGTNETLTWLSMHNENIDFFRGRQMKEECVKAELRLQERKYGLNEIEKSIFDCDNNSYMKGQMGFILEFSGAYELYGNNSINSMSQEDISNLAITLKNYTDKAITLFESLNPTNGNKIQSEMLFVKALLSFGVYMRPNTSKRLNFCYNYNDPYNSWKTLLYMEEETSSCRSLVKQVLDRLDKNDIEIGLRNIIDNRGKNLPQWRNELIKCPSLIKYCSQGFIWIEDWCKFDENYPNIILLSQSQMNHYHSDLYTRSVYESLRKQNSPVHYKETKKYDDDTSVYIKFKYKESTYELHTYFWSLKWSCCIYDQEFINVTDQRLFKSIIPDTQSWTGENIIKSAIINIENVPEFQLCQ